jgi:hypothetical protein
MRTDNTGITKANAPDLELSLQYWPSDYSELWWGLHESKYTSYISQPYHQGYEISTRTKNTKKKNITKIQAIFFNT